MDKELLLQNYFSNQLTNDERELFNKLLSSDSDFKAQFDFEQDLKQAIRDKENVDLKSKLMSFEKEIAKETPKSSSQKNYRFLAIAASIALLVGLAWMGYTDGSSSNYEDLYAANFQEYPNTVFTITRSETVASVERDAFVAYESRNYELAIDKFNQIPIEEQQAYVDFYVAQAYLSSGKNQNAKDYFNKVIAKSDTFVAESHWYLAMIALKEKDKTNAKSELQKLIDGFDYNNEKAVTLLKELN